MTQVHSDHLIGKVIVYLGYLVTGTVSIELQSPYVALVFGTALWLFGVNTAAYAVETVRGHAHRHHVV